MHNNRITFSKDFCAIALFINMAAVTSHEKPRLRGGVVYDICCTTCIHLCEILAINASDKNKTNTSLFSYWSKILYWTFCFAMIHIFSNTCWSFNWSDASTNYSCLQMKECLSIFPGFMNFMAFYWFNLANLIKFH